MDTKWGGVTLLQSEQGTGTTRNLSANVWNATRTLTLTPGWWVAFGSVRISGTAANTPAFACIAIGANEDVIRSRNTAPLNVGSLFTSVQGTTYFRIENTVTITMYVLVSAATTSKGEYLNAIKLADL